ncbi:MAG: helix-turn-helix domain-containing protein [Candidatus Manganitrophus sp. SB1]|jgi:predicted DNA-binding transcriptional regulator AlpA|nr:helix-turn-helix domain-containing protein [Candidatus Manganitrophus morganii]
MSEAEIVPEDLERLRLKVMDLDPDELYVERQAAQFLKVSEKTLQSWRFTGNGPKFVRISKRCVRYRRRDLTDWIEQHLKASTSER